MTVVDIRQARSAGRRREPAYEHPVRLGLICGLVTAAIYFLGAGRALDYDGSITTGLFVKHGSLLDVFRSVYTYNNQPYFSFVEHIVWSAGGRSEAWLRVAPVLAGAVAVGLLATWCARRWGRAAGIVAASILAANPMFASLARSVRGYSLMVLGCTAATLIFIEARERPRSTTTAMSACYVVALGIAIGTQFYAVFVLGAHIAVLVHDRRLDDGWRRRIAGVLAIGALPYLGMVRGLLATSRARKGTFLPSFPIDATREVLGHQPVAVVLLGGLVVAAFFTVGWPHGPLPAVATVAVELLVIWVVLHPLDLYPRFVVWLVPAVALGIAFVVAHHPRLPLLVPVGLAIAVMVLSQAGSWTSDPIASREIAHVVDHARAHGASPCATGSNGEVLSGYTRAVRAVTTAADLGGCDLLFGMPQTSGPLLRSVACHFDRHTVLPGTVAIVVMTHPNRRHPAPC